ncbi:MAG TPA: hypothetical protein DF712_17415 [Balneola sp.]|jgi:hypothetical protein|nr:hypothetical protein [Bacteroidota bacterium]MAC06380.1 hypothetical protein [Balneola sp.]MAO78573.1 hypothetical protein [Balneola sp.]MBF63197.1 hypothetical protein [Balneola sp.]HAH52481.1 hypothetical protein [Balneola sp.]|tara:strand:+ start:1226 stop:1495 length:270 start_codon:yes stop_codon:yes gene_type:complete
MFNDPKPNEIENWVCVLERSTKLEVELAKSYLSSLKIPSNILSKQDSSYSLSVGDMSFAYLYVPKEFEQEAREALSELDKANGEEGEDS